MSDKKLFLLDGHALVYRAHFAFINRPLVNSKGVNTSAIAGFVRTLWDILQTQKPSHIAVAFDPEGPTFRHEAYEPYKANREEQPEDIAVAIPIIKKIVQAFHIPIVVVDRFEADDVIGTLAKQAEKEGFQVYMVTPDKDFGQLVSEQIFLYKPSRQGNGVDIMGIPEILAKWNIQSVHQVVDMLGLQGDSVDNIPGVPGIGPKTAAKLLARYESVEGLLANVEDLKGKQKERVIENHDQALMSKQLARINTEAPIQFDEQRYRLDPFDREKLADLFRELEFRTLAKAILGEPSNPEAKQGNLFDNRPSNPSSGSQKAPPRHSVAEKNLENTPHTYHKVDRDADIEELVEMLKKEAVLCFDTETSSLDANQAELVGLAFAKSAGEAWYVPMPKDQEQTRERLEHFRVILENPEILKIGQNIKYDILILKWYDIHVKGDLWDTMVIHYLLEPELRHNMGYLAETYLKYQPLPIEKLIGKKGKNQLSMRDVPVDKVVEYAGEDADVTFQLAQALEPELRESPKLGELYDKIEAPLIYAIAQMEYNGVRVDVDFLQQYSQELGEQIDSLERKVHEDAGTIFNLASPKQVGEVLFEKMGLPYRWKKTKSGQYSTNEEKLTELAKDYPIVEKILTHRGLTKLKSTYVDALPRLVNPRSGRIHSSFNQALAATGRLSSQNPNLQNIPIRTPEGRRIREAFIPRGEEYLLLAADYSQIELRLIAEISGDEAMLEAFQQGKDIHRATAARVYEVDYDSVTSTQRRNAKTVNFSIIYGAGSTNLSRQLDISRGEARELIDQYFKQYAGLKNYMDTIVKEAREKGYVTTLMGRRRYIRDIDSRNGMLRSNAERIAINTPIQGSAADMIKVAMVDIHQLLQEYRSTLILQVHDELVFDLHREEQEELMPIIRKKMKEALPGLSVPILVEMEVGQNWLEAH